MNNNNIKKIISIPMIIIIIIFMVSNCSPLFISKFYNDSMNPCGGINSDSVECEYWKEKYPKEYEKFLKRILIDSI